MSTSDPLSHAPASGGALDVPHADFAQQLQQLANQFFSGVPGPGLEAPSGVPSGAAAPGPPPAVSVAPALGPSALAVGAGGASPAVTAPPIPGVLKAPPLSTAPAPKEADLRTAPAMFAESIGTSPLALAGHAEPAQQDTPYFLGLAGVPGSPSSASALGAPTGGVPVGGAPSVGSLPLPAGSALPTAEPPSVPSWPELALTRSPGPSFGAAPQGLGPSDPQGLGQSDLAGLQPSPRTPAVVNSPSVVGSPVALGAPSQTGALPRDSGAVPAVHSLPLPNTEAPARPGSPAFEPPHGFGFSLPESAPSGFPAGFPQGLPSGLPQGPGPTDLVGHAAAPSASPTQAARFAPDIEASTASQHRLFDPHAVKRDFPILRERVNGKQLVWLDNAATTQKPRAVIDRLSYFYEHENSNIHRAAHALAARATDAYEAARETTRRFLNAPSTKNIVFARGTTETINLVAQAWGRRHLTAGDEIVITWLEHHANIVPWQMLCREKGARLCVAPVDDSGQVILEEYERLLGPRTRLVAFGQVSNALGTIVPAREMVEIAHRYGAKVLVDGAQAVSHLRVDVQALDCDFYCFSGHKIFGPTGIGVLYGKSDALESMPPWQGGGNMIDCVTFEKTTYRPPPDRFEAGTGNIADAVGLGAALDYVSGLGLENIARHEHDLLVYATERLLRIPGLRLFGTAAEKAGVLSFVLDGHRPEDVGEALDQEGIAVRAGHHCAQPILRRFGVEATVRASLAPYNTREDIDALVTALSRLQAGRPG